MLKKIRQILALVFFVAITFFFIDFAELLPNQFHALEHIQFIPALMGLSAFILLGLIALTLLFGRIYCSVICPLGVFQDLASWLAKRVQPKKKKRYSYSPAKTVLRWSVVALVVALFAFGITALLSLLDPYAAYGRMATHLFRPVYQFGNNLFATWFPTLGLYRVEVFILSVSSLIVAVATFLIIGFLAWRYGRTYCNTICPVGTVLGFLSKYSLFKVRIDTHKCNHCGLCARACKASCINSKEQEIDYSRCVDCFDCLGTCNKSALRFAPRLKKANAPTGEETTDNSRRKFFLTGLTSLAAPALFAQAKPSATGIRQKPIAPPGAQSVEHLSKHCTACHLCVSRCPSRVLKPAFTEYGLGGVMQPMMYFQKGYCNYNCTICSEVCPNGALLPLTEEAKHTTQVGYVQFNHDICVVVTNGTNCGACAEHCPTQAVKMVPYRDGLTIPELDVSLCVGCGGCEFICPVRPNRAIYVEGHEEHQEAMITKSEKLDVVIDDFGF